MFVESYIIGRTPLIGYLSDWYRMDGRNVVVVAVDYLDDNFLG